MYRKIKIIILFFIVCFSVIAFFKDDLNLSKGIVYKTKNATLKTLKIDLNKDKVYLAIGEEYQLIADIETNKNNEMEITWSSKDENIATVSNGLIKGITPGTTKITVITADNVNKEVEVIVTDLVTTPKVNTSKSFLPCKRYSEEEAKLLDEVFFDRINEAGYGTRMGPVAVARFILLEFQYKIKYFNENGRLNNHSGSSHVDGEGRYYHRGLYLHESKFESITATRYGPAIWGCNLYDAFLGGYRPNGLTCSGFVTWVLLNGGFDIGDSGAGNTYRDDDVGDIGENIPITKELMQSGKVKVGDIIGRDGHVAIIIGLDEEYIYIAESLPPEVRLVTLTKYDGLLKSDNFDFIILMDDIYKSDGNYTEMW